MSSFEFAQLTVQGVGVIAVLATLYFYYRQLHTMDRQQIAIEREMAARMRPWVGLFGFEFEAHEGSAEHGDVLRVLLRNCGALPAQSAQLQLVLRPETSAGGDEARPIQWRESGEKALVPGEDGRYRIELARHPQVATWRAQRRNVIVEGTMQYALDRTRYQTTFEAVLRFAGAEPGSQRVETRWRNLSVV